MSPVKNIRNIVKSNTIIEARYRLSLQEQHVVLWLLSQIKPEDKDFKPHSMQISEFAKMIGIKASGQYSEMRKITEKLMRRIMNIYEPELDEWLQVGWLSSARYKKKHGQVVLEFSPQLKPYLLQLKSCFTKINLVDALSFKSTYGYRIYELLVQYRNIGSRKTTIEELRCWCGIAEDEYRLYASFKRDVLNRAKEEINKKTDYEIDFEEIKQSRKVIAIEWRIGFKSGRKDDGKTNTSNVN